MTFLINATDTQGNIIKLPNPISMQISMAADTPADSLSLTFPCIYPLGELAEITVGIDGSTVFSGIVDEQIMQYSGGCTVRINARSLGALLIDNEAIPANYHTPSLADIFSIHAQPYGIKDFIGDNGVCSCDFTVKKGVSEWEAIESFCKSVLNAAPSVTKDGFLDVRKDKSQKHYTFSNTKNGAVKFNSAKVKHQRYGVVSQVTYKLSSGSDYIYTYPNDSAISRGIRRRRLLNLSSSAPEFNDYRIRNVISSSERDSTEITLTVPQLCISELFGKADFEDCLLGTFTDLRINEILFSLTSSGCYTRVTLCPKELTGEEN